jgi:hypothetical protein
LPIPHQATAAAATTEAMPTTPGDCHRACTRSAKKAHSKVAQAHAMGKRSINRERSFGCQ